MASHGPRGGFLAALFRTVPWGAVRSMWGMRLTALPWVVLLFCTACTTVPERAYFPPADRDETRVLATTLYRVASAAGDDPARYSFALIATRDVSAFTAEDATFYFSEGPGREPDLEDRLAALEPLEPLNEVARRPPDSTPK